jgi:phage shock protein A
VQQAVRDVSVMDPTSELRRFEDRVRHEEALARGMEEVASESIDEQFAQLAADDDEREVEARLARLKSGQGQQALSGR